jgi:hypothetical protein
VTPLTADGSLDEGVLRALIDGLVPQLDGLFVLGSSGELAWLRDEVAARVARGAWTRSPGGSRLRRRRGHGLARTLERVDRLGTLGATLSFAAYAALLRRSSEARLVEHFAASPSERRRPCPSTTSRRTPTAR